MTLYHFTTTVKTVDYRIFHPTFAHIMNHHHHHHHRQGGSSSSDTAIITPLPLPNHHHTGRMILTYDPHAAASSSSSPLQQPLYQELASFTAEPADYAVNGANLMAVNAHFVVYAVKNGLIRVLSRSSPQKSLLRSHQHQVVSDLQFSTSGDLLATVSATTASTTTTTTNNSSSGSSKIVIWHIPFHHDHYDHNDDIRTDPILEIASTTTKMIRVVWHPYSRHQLLIVHDGSSTSSGTPSKLRRATLVDISRQLQPSPNTTEHAVVDWEDLDNNHNNNNYTSTLRIEHPDKNASLHDVAWSGIDPSCLVAVYDNGHIVAHHLPPPDELRAAAAVAVTILHPVDRATTAPIHRILFLPHANAVVPTTTATTRTATATTTTTTKYYTTCFVTCGDVNNATVSLWSAYTSDALPQILQTIHIVASSSSVSRPFVWNVGHGPPPNDNDDTAATTPSCFLTAAGGGGNNNEGCVLAISLLAQWSDPDEARPQQQQRRVPLLRGANYIVPFRTPHPILSGTMTCCAPSVTEEDSDYDPPNHHHHHGINFDMKLFVYQTLAASCLQFTSPMLRGPTTEYREGETPGVTVHATSAPAVVTTKSTTTDIHHDHPDDNQNHHHDGFEEYEIDETEDDEYDAAPDPSTLPMPSMMTMMMGNNTSSSSDGHPFSNWLGALAATPSTMSSPAQSTNVPITSDRSNNHHHQQRPANPPVLQSTVNVAATTTLETTPAPLPSSNVTTALLSPMEILGLMVPPAPPSKHDQAITHEATPPHLAPTIATTPAAPIAMSKTTTNGTMTRNELTTVKDAVADESVKSVLRAMFTEEFVPLVRREMDAMIQPLIDIVTPMPSSIHELKVQQQQSQSQNGSTFTMESERMTAQVTADLQEGMKVMWTDCIRSVLIPTIESVTNQILEKVSQHVDTKHHQDQTRLDAMTQQLAQMSTLVAELTNKVTELRTESRPPVPSLTTTTTVPMHAPITAVSVAPPSGPPAEDPMDQLRNDIVQQMKLQNYEVAFRRAVSSNHVATTVFACRQVNMSDIFGVSPPAVSQPILLCLLQQLGTVLLLDTTTDAAFLVEWLQEITVGLYPPVDPQIRPHLPVVVQNLVSTVTKRIEQQQSTSDDNDPMLRRSLLKLQSLLRGLGGTNVVGK